MIQDRSAGFIRVGLVKQWPGSGITDIAKRLGLASAPETYQRISSSDAKLVLAWILHKDLAYSQELIPLNLAQERSAAIVAALPDSAVYYYNGLGPDTMSGRANGFNPATESTMDAGILALCGDFGCGIWVEDED
jgi:hypothetical protein